MPDVGRIDEVTSELMLAFYRRLYPFKSIFGWLNHEHEPKVLFTHREFALTLQGDVYLRYQSFANAEELKKQVCEMNPTRFEIGPVYSARVCPFIYNDEVIIDCEISPETRKLFVQLHSNRHNANLSSISI